MNKDDVMQRLVSRGVLPTAQRVEVGLLLFARPQHLSADQIIAGVYPCHARRVAPRPDALKDSWVIFPYPLAWARASRLAA